MGRMWMVVVGRRSRVGNKEEVPGWQEGRRTKLEHKVSHHRIVESVVANGTVKENPWVWHPKFFLAKQRSIMIPSCDIKFKLDEEILQSMAKCKVGTVHPGAEIKDSNDSFVKASNLEGQVLYSFIYLASWFLSREREVDRVICVGEKIGLPLDSESVKADLLAMEYKDKKAREGRKKNAC
ncbi:hypothetical protein RIF29_19022 [Crotalaria pallida]|uniref:Uncharacterized protein n=1 Tax=Crotalaria pallida TaxID=3830 RepID=A0AAN9I3S2_CROPI